VFVVVCFSSQPITIELFQVVAQLMKHSRYEENFTEMKKKGKNKQLDATRTSPFATYAPAVVPIKVNCRLGNFCQAPLLSKLCSDRINNRDICNKLQPVKLHYGTIASST
jgi:hypothetical protein